MHWTDAAKAVIPARFAGHATFYWRVARSLPYRGWNRECPICGTTYRRFAPTGTDTAVSRREQTVAVGRRQDALCIMCGARERHRLLWLYLNNEVGLGETRRVLQFAPNDSFDARLRAHPAVDYYTTNIQPLADVQSDITALPFADDAFDLLICTHVLEHISDERTALCELRRVCAPSGIALVMVPMTTRRGTIEDPIVETPAERQAAYGQVDHQRLYGRDVSHRLSEAGFTVTAVEYARELGAPATERYGLLPNERIYRCTVTE